MSDNPPEQSPAPNPPLSRGADWTWPDLLDFEFFLEQDRHESLARLEERDRQIYKGTMSPEDPALSSQPGGDRRWLFRRWLEARCRMLPPDQPPPGSLAWDSWRVLIKLLAVLGFLTGAGLAANLLRYDGLQPVNVAAYLGWLVLVQIGLILLALLALILRRTRLLKNEISLAGGLIRWVWSWLATRLARPALQRVPAEHRTRLQSFLGSLSTQHTVYGEALLWPMVSSLQRFGVFFNAGALAATLTLVMFSDRAFGWQSALDVSPEQIHQLVHTLSQPWAALLPEAAGPTLAQIEGSKIILKDGIKQLTTQNLVSWWPFLCAALVAYGLLPRLVLWILSAWMGRRALRKLSFEQVACDRLYERLMSGQIHTSGQGPQPAPQVPPMDESHATRHLPSAARVSTPSTGAALIPQDLFALLDQPAFIDLIRSRFRWDLVREQIHPWPQNSQDREETISQLSSLASSNTPPRILLLDEAWQPPIAEKLSALHNLRHALGPSAKIILTLVGRPDHKQILTPAQSSHLQVWTRAIEALGDPHLRVEPLMG